MQRQRLVSVMNVSILLYSLPMTPQQESGGQQPLHPYGAPGMDTGGADTHLGSKTVPESITEARRGVVVDTRCIYPSQELLSSILVLCSTHHLASTAPHQESEDSQCTFEYVDGKLQVDSVHCPSSTQ